MRVPWAACGTRNMVLAASSAQQATTLPTPFSSAAWHPHMLSELHDACFISAIGKTTQSLLLHLELAINAELPALYFLQQNTPQLLRQARTLQEVDKCHACFRRCHIQAGFLPMLL